MPSGVRGLRYSICDSTNIRAQLLAGEAGQNAVRSSAWVQAVSQSAGRGRRGRPWVSRPGNLYASHLFYPTAPRDALRRLPFSVALAIVEALVAEGVNPESVTCKWPNDILIHDRKVAGILIESAMQAGQDIDHIVIGIGINLAHAPDDARFPATSVTDATGVSIAPEALLQDLARTLAVHLESWQSAPFEPVRQAWLARAWGLGRRQRITMGSGAGNNAGSFEARLKDLAEDGALVVMLDDGREKRLYAGDVFAAAAP